MAIITFVVAFVVVLGLNMALRNLVAPDRELVWVPLIIVTAVISGAITFAVVAIF